MILRKLKVAQYLTEIDESIIVDNPDALDKNFLCVNERHKYDTNRIIL